VIEEYKCDVDEFVSGMRLEITGFINGEGKLLIIHPPYNEGRAKTFDLNGKINIITRTDWYEPECIIKFIPNNEFIDGDILIKLLIY
jgi:hypothetical protein